MKDDQKFISNAPVIMLPCFVCKEERGYLIFNDRAIRDQAGELLESRKGIFVHSNEEAMEYCTSPGVITPGGDESAKGMSLECPCGTVLGGIYFPNMQSVLDMRHLVHIDKTWIRCIKCCYPNMNRILKK